MFLAIEISKKRDLQLYVVGEEGLDGTCGVLGWTYTEARRRESVIVKMEMMEAVWSREGRCGVMKKLSMSFCREPPTPSIGKDLEEIAGTDSSSFEGWVIRRNGTNTGLNTEERDAAISYSLMM